MTRWAMVALAAGSLALGGRAHAQSEVGSFKPQYLPPAELVRAVGVRERQGRDVLEWQVGQELRTVTVLRNDAANLIMLVGEPRDVAAAELLVKAADIPPRQIMIDAAIVEVNRDRVRDLGLDWSRIQTRADITQDRSKDVLKSNATSQGFGSTFRNELTADRLRIGASAGLFNSLHLLEESGAATFRDAPRILTLNNRRATILDGQRVTYITRYSSYTNLFETDTLDAGLTVTVLPSLGESGYLTLDIRAELTSLGGAISGSPVKDGQIVENTVIVRAGETILLGGFLRTVEEKRRRRFPILGHALPFLFSREITVRTRRESFVVLTPTVVDLAAGVDERTRGIVAPDGAGERR